jgi:hypothetical protein
VLEEEDKSECTRKSRNSKEENPPNGSVRKGYLS